MPSAPVNSLPSAKRGGATAQACALTALVEQLARQAVAEAVVAVEAVHQVVVGGADGD